MFAYCLNNPVRYTDFLGTYSTSVPALSKGLNLPAGQGVPVLIGGETYYYYSVVQRGGYEYEYWYDENGNLVHVRHNTDHKQPWAHEDPHDHKGGKDKDGHNTIEKKPLPKDDQFKGPDKSVQAQPYKGNNLGKAVIGVSAIYVIYQVAKWAAAAAAVSVTGGFSYAAAGMLP